MFKKVTIIFLCCIVILVTGCEQKRNQKDGIPRIHLSDMFYNQGNYIDVQSDTITSYDNDNYILFTNTSYCSMSVPCDKIFEEFMKKYKIDFLAMSFDEFKKTSFYETVKYAPSVLIVEHGNIKAYLDANLDADLQKYQNANEFENWLDKYIYFSK